MDRRSFLAAAPALLPAAHAQVAPGDALRRRFGRHAETVPVVGMGTWLTFDVGDAAFDRAQRRQVLQAFFAAGGGMIDSSPMYGRAEKLLGELLPQVPHAGRLFAATKVWTGIERVGPQQAAESLKLWGLPRFDLLQVHNLLAWRGHLKTLRAWQAEGRARYIGITTSHGRKHDEVEAILKREPLDALQITWNLADRSAEPLLELAAARGVAVIVNRPFDGGLLFNRVAGRPLPGWAAEAGCADWPQFFLKWALAHPAVTCVIPATTQPAHMAQNMAAARGRLPDVKQRRQMADYWDQL
jgi:diketogulonate reductase-like aldo/keto reductase